MKETVRFITGIYKELSQNHIFLYTAQTAYYVIFSFFPLLMLVLMSVKALFPESVDAITDYVAVNFPEFYERLPSDFLVSILRADVPVFSLTLVALLWSASKWARSLSSGLDVIYCNTDPGKFYKRYLFSFIWTVCFIIAATASLGVMVYGRIFSDSVLSSCRGVIICAFMTVFILMINRFMPAKRKKLKELLPGAVFSAAGWTVYSSFFSVYAANYSNYSILYGSIGLFLMLMLWVYNCVLILFLGAKFNIYLMNKPLIIK